jgi:hypothetical protein
MWACLLLTGTIIETIALRRRMHEHTLSHATRVLFQVHRPAGRFAFMATWLTIVIWFQQHILNGQNKP